MITTVTQHPSVQEKSTPSLRSLVVINQPASSLTSLFINCGYQADMTSFNDDYNHKLADQYDMLFVEVEPGDHRGFDLISAFLLKNQKANVVSMTKDNQKIVEKQVRLLKVDYHLISPYSTNEIISILTHLAVRQKKRKEEWG